MLERAVEQAPSMKPRRRWILVVTVLVALVAITIAAMVRWKVQRKLSESAAVLESQERFPVTVRPLSLAPNSRFEWMSTPAVFSSGAVFQGHLYLGGPAGLFAYSDSGELEKIYRVGQELPAFPLVSLTTGTLVDSHQPELLIATAGAGVLAFDGNHLRQIVTPSADVNDVKSLRALSSGRLLIGTAKRGLLVYDGREIRYFHSSLRSNYITAIEGSESDLWIGTLDSGVFHWQGGSIEALSEAEGLPDQHVDSIALREGSAFIATPNGIAQISQGHVQRVVGKGVFSQTVYDAGKGLIVGTPDQGVLDLSLEVSARAGLRARRGERAADERLSGIAVQQVFSSGQDLYAVAQDGLYRREGSALGWKKVLSGSQAMLTDRNVSALAVDGKGQLWVGYFDRGLDILSPGVQSTTHIEDSHVYCINRILPDSRRGMVDVATANGLVLFDGNGKQRQILGKANGLIAEHVTDVAFYSGGTVAATPAGLTFLDETGVHSLYAFQGLVNNHVYALGTSGSRLLAGTLGGLSILEGGHVVKNFTTSTSLLKHNWITAIVPVGQEWFVGTYGAGVQRLDADGHFAATEATRPGTEINPNAILATNQHIFAGTLGSGLLVGDRSGSHWQTIQAGLPSLNVTALAQSGGILYIGTDNGLVKISEERLEQ